MNITELERLCLAATPGPWHSESDTVKNDPYNRVRYQVTAVGKTITQIYYSSFEGGTTNAGDDADYIAAVNPQTILAMIELLREMGECLEYEVEILGFDAACARDALKKYREMTK